MQNALKNIARLSIAGLIIFELLNWLGILHFTLDFTWLGLTVTSLPSWILLEYLNRHFKKNYQSNLPGVLYLIAALALYLDALGDILKFYSTYNWYDQAAHFLGSMAASAVILTIVLKKKINLGNFGIGLIALAITTLGSVLYEIEEYIEDLLFATNRLGPGTDTANDLLWNLIGALIVVVLYFAFKPRKYKR